MKVGEFVNISRNILQLLSKYDVRISDYKYWELYKEYEELKKTYKVTYVVYTLAEKYNISEASVYRIIKRFRETINL